jgi:hypothetical protein
LQLVEVVEDTDGRCLPNREVIYRECQLIDAATYGAWGSYGGRPGSEPRVSCMTGMHSRQPWFYWCNTQRLALNTNKNHSVQILAHSLLPHRLARLPQLPDASPCPSTTRIRGQGHDHQVRPPLPTCNLAKKYPTHNLCNTFRFPLLACRQVEVFSPAAALDVVASS